MTVHDCFDDPIQPRHAQPAGSPPERFPDVEDDATEANDEDEDFDDEDADEDEEDNEEEPEDE